MKVRLDQIADQPYTWQQREHLPAAALERSEVIELSDIEWRGRIERLETGFLLRATIEYEQTLECPRCLKRVPMPVVSELELLILQDAPQPTVGEYELEESDLGVLHVEGEELDTLPVLLEQLQLEVPMKPLCRPDCAGLCPICGADRADGECECEEPPSDPRWSALEGLKRRLDN